MRRLLSLIVTSFASLIFVACSSTTMIRSSDPQAKIYIDGEMRGRGTVTQTDTKIVGSSTSVKIQRDGCEPQFYNYSRSEEFDVGACIGGVFVLVPFLWIEKYKPEHNFEYECVATKEAKAAAAEQEEAPHKKASKKKEE